MAAAASSTRIPPVCVRAGVATNPTMNHPLRLLPFALLGAAALPARLCAQAGDAAARAAALLDRIDKVRLGGAKADVDRSHVVLRGTFDLVVGGPKELKLQGPCALWFDGERAVERMEYPGWGVARRGYEGELVWEDHPAFGARVYHGADAETVKRCLRLVHYPGWRALYSKAELAADATVDG